MWGNPHICGSLPSKKGGGPWKHSILVHGLPWQHLNMHTLLYTPHTPAKGSFYSVIKSSETQTFLSFRNHVQRRLPVWMVFMPVSATYQKTWEQYTSQQQPKYSKCRAYSAKPESAIFTSSSNSNEKSLLLSASFCVLYALLCRVESFRPGCYTFAC